MSKHRILFATGILCAIAFTVFLFASSGFAATGEDVRVQDPTTVTRAPAAPPPAAPAKPAPAPASQPQKPYVPPALITKIAPESNEILPPLFGWTRIVIHDLKMPDSDEVINNCGMKQDMIFQFFTSRLQDAGVPIISDDQAIHLIPDIVTVEAQPSITSMQDLVINCISYVQFRVKMDLTFRVPPLMYRRTVPILLWNDGVMVSSAKSTHNGAIINAFIGIAERFRDAWQKQNTLKQGGSDIQIYGH